MTAEIMQQLGQLGGLAMIAGLLAYQNREHQAQMARRLGSLEAAMLDLVRNNTAAMRDLAAVLHDRPCLHGHVPDLPMRAAGDNGGREHARL